MATKKDALGRRWVEMEYLVPGTPEQVWAALATGPGISAWFTTASVEEKVGGHLTFSFGELGSTSGTVTGWEPPHRFAYEERDWSENAPPVATEVHVTARAGGTCLVRMVHSLFASGDDWDDQLESFEAGWPGNFEVLRIYLTHFAGTPSALARASILTSTEVAEAWSKLTQALGVSGVDVGERRRTPGGAPPLSGLVERVHQDHTRRELTLRLDQPGPGVAIVSAHRMRGSTLAALWTLFYGDSAEQHARQIEASASRWIAELLPAAPVS